MKLKISGMLAIATFAVFWLLGSGQSLAQNAYIANLLSDNVTVVDTRTNAVIGAPIPVGDAPRGVAVSPDGASVYVTNVNSGTVSVIDARTNTAAATFVAGINPSGVAVSPNGTRLYVANYNFPVSTVTVIDAATGATVAAIPTAGDTNSIATLGVAVSPDGKKVYALNTGPDAIRVIDAATNSVIKTISTPGTFNAFQAAFSPDGSRAYISQQRFPTATTPTMAVLTIVDVGTSTVVDTVVLGSADNGGNAGTDGVAMSPDGKKVYVMSFLIPAGAPFFTSQVTVVDAATNAIAATIPVGADGGISITPDGGKLYVVNASANEVSVIDTATNAIVATVPVGALPISVGNFIQPAPRFAGTPGKANCHGQSVSALAKQYGGLNNAAAALRYPSVNALQNAIMEFCGA